MGRYSVQLSPSAETKTISPHEHQTKEDANAVVEHGLSRHLVRMVHNLDSVVHSKVSSSAICAA